MHFLAWRLQTEGLLEDTACSGGCQSQAKTVDGGQDLTGPPSLRSPHGAESPHMHTFLTSPNQPLLTCCDSEGGTEMHKVIPSTALSKWELKKSPGDKGFVLRTQGQMAVGCHTQEPMPVWDAWVDKFSWLKMHVTLLN